MSRDLAAEHQADLVAKELADLRALRDAVQEVGRALGRSNRYETLSDKERDLIDITFDRDGMGPFVTLSPTTAHRIVRLANLAKCSEVSW